MHQIDPSADPDTPSEYQFTINEHLHQHWSEWFENMRIEQHPDGTSTLSGPVKDQAALYGLLNKLRDLGLTLLRVELLADDMP